jgi:hypothetical protein
MNAHNLRSWRVVPGLVIVASLLLSGAAMASAPEVAPTPPQAGPSGPAAPVGTEDGGAEVLDVGAEFSSATVPPGTSGALPYTSDSAWNFYNKMRAAGYTGPHSFIFGNNMAWASDWTRAALGGNENGWVDNVDIMFFHDHGSNGAMWFPWGTAGTGGQWVVPNDCLGSWGDKDVEWIGIKSCLTLSDVAGWANCMNGVHLIAGMVPISYGADYGGDWADQLLGWYLWPFGWLRSPKTVTQAWFTACDSSQPSSVVARVIAEDWRHFDDKVWNRGGPVYGDIVNWPKYYLDHTCYKPPARQVDVDALYAAAVNTYVVEPRDVNQAYAQGVANALGLQGDVQCPPGGTECGLVASQGSQSLSLSIPTASGGFVLQNTDQLWAAQNPAAPLTLPTEDAATILAGSYLDSHQALPGSGNIDKASAHYVQDTQTEVTVQPIGATAAGSAEILQTQGTGVLVAYGRTLPTGVHAASGAMIDVGTVGPGSATKVYYGGASAALRGPRQEQLPIGLLGGSRDVKEGATTTPKAYQDSWAEFLADRQLAVASIPLDWDTAQLVGQTFSYYEQSQGVKQKELIPVWVFTADLYKGSDLVGDNATLYVPANNDYYPPNVTIDAPTAGSEFVAGQWVDLQATTSGGYDPFTYEWSSSTQGSLVEGNQEDVKAMLLGKSDKLGETTPVAITLKVTNQNGQSRTAEVIVNVVGRPQWLPLVIGKK